MILSTLTDDPTLFRSFGIYHPYRKGTNPNWDHFSEMILALKNKKLMGFLYFLEGLENVFTKDTFTIVTVPSHDPENTDSGIKQLATMLCANNQRVDGTSCLVRHTKVEKSSTGGSRNQQKHINSIQVQNSNLITGKDVLLLDDVTTTHSSLSACKYILQQYHPNVVIPYALAQTAQNE